MIWKFRKIAREIRAPSHFQKVGYIWVFVGEMKDIKVDDASFEKDNTYIKARLKAYIGKNLWSNEGWYIVMLDVDPQIQKAMTLFPEAQKIAGLNKYSGNKTN